MEQQGGTEPRGESLGVKVAAVVLGAAVGAFYALPWLSELVGSWR